MQSLIVPVLLLASAQQAPVSQPTKYIPPPPKPAVVKPAFAPTALFQLQKLLTPTPETKAVLPRSKPDKPALRQPVRYFVPAPKRIEAATRVDLKKQNNLGVTSFIHRVKHVSAKELARGLGRKFAMNQVINVSLRKNKTNALLVIIPEEKTNQLIITTSPWNVDEIKRLISELDRKPKQFQIDATITIVNAEGKKIVSSPRIVTTEGRPATVRVANADGTSIELQINVSEWKQPQQTLPTVKKATAGKIYPQPMQATPATAAYRPIVRKPVSLNGYRAISASIQPAYSPYRPTKWNAQQAMWKELHRQTDREKEIQQALEKKVSLHFEDGRLIDLIKYISKAVGINVVFDQTGLEEEGLTKDSKVTIDVDGIRLKSALNTILKPIRLAYKVEDEVLKITSKSRAQGPLKTVNYPVGNLLVVSSPGHAAISSETLINLITSLIEPNSWSQHGGQGVIHEFETTQSLVIRQTEQGHAKIKKLLDSLRDAKQSKSE